MNGTFMVSLDFELFWGMLEVVSQESYRDNVLGGKKAIGQLLQLFETYGIHATWATVGFLFADNYEELAPFFPENRPSYENPELNYYANFEKIGSSEETAPCFYAPGLLERIAKTPGQEIGSHTFCHYYCREAGQTVEQFAADMEAAKAIAKAKGYDVTSVILPRNQSEPEYTEVLRKLGFTAYRAEEDDWIHRNFRKKKWQAPFRALHLLDMYLPLTGRCCYAPRFEDGICNLVGSRIFRPIFRPLEFLEGLKLRRIKGEMRYAAKHGLVYHLWWHPHNLGVRTEENLAQLEELFRYYTELKEQYGMQSLNMGEAAEAAALTRKNIAEKYGLQNKNTSEEI
mgnify:FL=1